MSKFTFAIDKGHGGMIDGIYQTLPSKMYEHSPTEIFYEGVWNRLIGDLLLSELEARGIDCIDTTGSQMDIPLDIRVDVINTYYRKYPNLVLISLHANAGGGTGFEVWTSVGQTKSDVFAEVLAHEIMARFDEPFRQDKQDGDLDKEDHFYILKNTHCPAVLPECLFYDNYADYVKLIDPAFQKQYVETLVNFVLKSELVLS